MFLKAIHKEMIMIIKLN